MSTQCDTQYSTLVGNIYVVAGFQPDVGAAVASGTLFGIITCLAFASICALRSIEHKITRICCFVAILCLHASTTCYWISIVVGQVKFTESLSTLAQFASTSPSQPLNGNSVDQWPPKSQWQYAENTSPCIQTATLTINVLIGDAIVWWRACSLWTGRAKRYQLALCALVLLATFALSVADTCDACLHGPHNLSKEDPGVGQLFTGARLGVAAGILSLTTNLGATISIGYKTWSYKQNRKKNSLPSLKSGAQGILMLFVESGILYCITWLFVVIYLAGEDTEAVTFNVQSNSSFWTVTGHFVTSCLVPIIAIYPMMIIVIVAMKKSAMQQVLISNPPSSIPMTTFSNSTTSRTVVVNVNHETTTHQDSVIYIRDMSHKDDDLKECRTSGDVRRESDVED